MEQDSLLLEERSRRSRKWRRKLKWLWDILAPFSPVHFCAFSSVSGWIFALLFDCWVGLRLYATLARSFLFCPKIRSRRLGCYSITAWPSRTTLVKTALNCLFLITGFKMLKLLSVVCEFGWQTYDSKNNI